MGDYIFMCKRTGKALSSSAVEPGDDARAVGSIEFTKGLYWAFDLGGAPLSAFESYREACTFLGQRSAPRHPTTPGRS